MHNFRTNNFQQIQRPYAAAATSARTVTIIDPAFRTGKLDIPIEKTSATKGRDEWLEGKLRNRDLSLCCLFQKGRCHAQERCHQVHADRDYVASLRDQQSTVVSCCRQCHDTASLSAAAMNFFATNMPTTNCVHITFGEHDEPNVIPASRISYTDGLIQQFRDHGCREENGVIAVPARRVCRLHAKGVCKYGKDCKNVHVCCQLGEAVMIRRATPSNTNTTTPAKANVSLYASPAKQQSPPIARSPAAAPPQAFKPVQAMPVFALPPPAPIITTTPARDVLSSTAAPSAALNRSGKLKSLDADSLNESSGRMRALVFDVLKCLEDSSVDGPAAPKQAHSPTATVTENFSYFSSTKSSVRGGVLSENNSPNTKALHWGEMHPCSATPKMNILSPAAVDTNTFLRFF